jgi:hypothetical protein
MKTPLTAFAASVLVLSMGVSGARAGEEKTIKQSDVPGPVLGAVAKKYPNAKMKKFETEQDEGKPIFEVQVTSGKDQISIDVSPEGKILAEETVIKPSDLPAPVKAGLAASKYKTWKLAKAEKVIENEKDDSPAYEVVVQQKKEKVEVVFDKDGKITKEEAKSAKDND